MTQQRLQKVLASAGVSSRRAAEDLIARGTVTVNGRVAVVGQPVDPDADIIRVDGRLITAGAHLYLALHKPEGYVSTTVVESGQQSIMDLTTVEERVYPVGRLDLDSAGLLLLTNDGDWANLVLHPRYEIEKEYVVVVRGHPSKAKMEQLRLGVRLPSGDTTSPAEVRTVQRTETTSTLEITVHEGKKRQIRLMMAAVGHPVMKLTRVRIGPIRLGALERGASRDLTVEEVEAVRVAARAARHDA